MRAFPPSAGIIAMFPPLSQRDVDADAGAAEPCGTGSVVFDAATGVGLEVDEDSGGAIGVCMAAFAKELSSSWKGLGDVEYGARTCARGECGRPLIPGNCVAAVLKKKKGASGIVYMWRLLSQSNARCAQG